MDGLATFVHGSALEDAGRRCVRSALLRSERKAIHGAWTVTRETSIHEELGNCVYAPWSFIVRIWRTISIIQFEDLRRTYLGWNNML